MGQAYRIRVQVVTDEAGDLSYRAFYVSFLKYFKFGVRVLCCGKFILVFGQKVLKIEIRGFFFILIYIYFLFRYFYVNIFMYIYSLVLLFFIFIRVNVEILFKCQFSFFVYFQIFFSFSIVFGWGDRLSFYGEGFLQDIVFWYYWRFYGGIQGRVQKFGWGIEIGRSGVVQFEFIFLWTLFFFEDWF